MMLTFDQCSSSWTCVTQRCGTIQFYTHRTITWRWIESQKVSIVQMSKFKAVKSTTKIMWCGTFLFFLCQHLSWGEFSIRPSPTDIHAFKWAPQAWTHMNNTRSASRWSFSFDARVIYLMDSRNHLINNNLAKKIQLILFNNNQVV